MSNKLDFGFIGETKKEIQKAAALQAQNTINHFDSATGDFAEAVKALDDKAFDNEVLALRRDALFAVAQLAEDIIADDLEDGELPSDRLDALLVGDNEGYEGDEETDQLSEHILQIKAANMADALATFGVSDDLIEKAFGEDVDEADKAVEQMAEIVSVHLPEPEDHDEFIFTFIYGDSGLDMEAGQVNEFDGAQVGKSKVRKTKNGQTFVYKGVKAVRNGKITVVNKRVGNTTMKMKLSPKQKAALRKASMKAVTPNAIKRRVKSLRIGQRQGIYKINKGL